MLLYYGNVTCLLYLYVYIITRLIVARKTSYN